jgi:hypothetical protein
MVPTGSTDQVKDFDRRGNDQMSEMCVMQAKVA